MGAVWGDGLMRSRWIQPFTSSTSSRWMRRRSFVCRRRLPIVVFADTDMVGMMPCCTRSAATNAMPDSMAASG